MFDAKDKSKQLGEFEVFTDDKTNNFLGLVELKVKDKRKGTGKKIIDSLMQSDFVNDDFRIHSALKASIPFWKKMGTKFPEKDLRRFEKMKGHVNDEAIPVGIISKQAPKMLMPFGVGGLLSNELRNLDLGSFQSEDGFI